VRWVINGTREDQARRPLIVLGFDALDPGLVVEWARTGDMPTFGRLLETSALGTVDNPLGLEAGSVWPTFATGVMPDEHGHFNAGYIFDTTAYELRLRTAADRVREPFWVGVSNAGRRVAVVDVPYVLLEEQLNGIQVVDWLTHVRTWPAGLASQPSDLAGEIAAKHGVNPFTGPNLCPTNDAAVDTAAAIATFRDHLLSRVARKDALFRELLARERWDLFVGVFHEAHDVGHMCWHLHDAAAEQHDPELAAQVGDPLRAVYSAIDASVGRVLTAIDPEATVVLYLSHGMGLEHTATRFFDDILLALETAYESPQAPASRHWTDYAAPVYRALVPPSVRRRLANTTPILSAYHTHHIDQLKRRRFFELTPNHATGGVRINLKGRESAGCVAPGREFDALCDRLAQDLAEIVNLDTGRPLITSVLRTSDLYPGPMCHALPDLLVEWEKSGPINRVASPKIGTVVRRYHGVRTGDHVKKRGLVLGFGQGIAPGPIDRSIRAMDLAPTFAALLGLPGGGFAGVPIPEIVGTAAGVARDAGANGRSGKHLVGI
jgi:predicted AlkP superfamily phosphohydrolase/phosphomutase